jgi:hypothetical protein
VCRTDCWRACYERCRCTFVADWGHTSACIPHGCPTCKTRPSPTNTEPRMRMRRRAYRTICGIVADAHVVVRTRSQRRRAWHNACTPPDNATEPRETDTRPHSGSQLHGRPNAAPSHHNTAGASRRTSKLNCARCRAQCVKRHVINQALDARGRPLDSTRRSLQRDEQSAFSWDRHHGAAAAQHERARDAPHCMGPAGDARDHTINVTRLPHGLVTRTS